MRLQWPPKKSEHLTHGKSEAYLLGLTLANDIIRDFIHHVGCDGKTNALKFRQLERVDADNPASCADERPAGVAGVDGHIRLYITDPAAADPIGIADNPFRNGEA